MKNLLRSAVFAAAFTTIGGMATSASACNTEPYIGTICTFSFDWCPNGYVLADGRSLTIREYTALFGLIGFSYGGDGQNIFQIPDLRGRVPIGKGQGTGLPVNVTMTTKYGQQQTVLTAAQTPVAAHTHPATFTGTGGGGGGGGTTPVAFTANVSIPVTTGGTPVSAPTSGNVQLGEVVFNDAGSGATLTGPYNTATAAAGAAQVTGTASGTVNVPASGGGITGGTVTVGTNTVVQATTPINTMPPSIGMSVCIAVVGLYPNRP